MKKLIRKIYKLYWDGENDNNWDSNNDTEILHYVFLGISLKNV